MSIPLPSALRVWLPIALPIALPILLMGCGATNANRPVNRPGDTELQATGVARSGPRARAGEAGEAAAALETGATGGGVVALVAGQPLYVSELFEAWLHSDSPGVQRLIEELVLSRVVLAEAGRLAIVLSDETRQVALDSVRERMQQEVDKRGGALTMEEFISQRLGLAPEPYLERLERQTEIDLLAGRVVRAWLLASERAEVRVIVVDVRENADLVQARLAKGEDFGKLAGEFSVEESADRDGRIPPVVRGPAALARLAFSTPVGEVGGPVFEGGQWLFLMVDGRPKPLQGAWSELGQVVEASLEQRAIEDPEYWQWKAAMDDRYEVDMEPFLELVGDTVKH
ncbi:MAG: peptidylprolyl isomerase [Planctomycetota bacterium]